MILTCIPAVSVFAFLRLAAAIWICTHKGLYGQRVTGLGEGVSLEDVSICFEIGNASIYICNYSWHSLLDLTDFLLWMHMQWCSTQVIPPRVHADHVTMSALSRALGVAVRVEDTLDGRKKDLMAAELQSITRASNPRFRGIEDMYCVARGTPRVTLVRMYSHYDILYPVPPGATTSIGPNLLQPERQQQGGGGGGRRQHPPPPAVQTSSRRAGQGDADRAESSSQGAASASWFHRCRRGGSKEKQS